MMTPLVVVTGPPGAGKSTVARVLGGRFEPSVVVEGDAFFAFLARGAISPWLPESHAQNEIVTEAAARAAGRYATGGFTTTYDGIVGPWFLPTFASATGLPALEYVVLLPSVQVCVERVVSRSDHGFNDVNATRKMHDEFASAVLDQRHLVVNPPGDAAEVADLIERGLQTGRFRYDTQSATTAK
jgi:predicted ABC-type ATPase